MNRNEIVNRVKSNLRDQQGNTFKDKDIIFYIDEGIDRVRQVIVELSDMEYLKDGESIPSLLPSQYHHLLAVYSTSRCFSQDERHYQAVTFMNEFEAKLDKLSHAINNGEVVIKDKYGDEFEFISKPEYVVDNYFNKRKYDYCDREGVL